MKRRVFFLYVSWICFHTYLALLNTTQWWFRWQKMAPDWLWGGLVHLNLTSLLVEKDINCILVLFCTYFPVVYQWSVLDVLLWSNAPIDKNHVPPQCPRGKQWTKCIFGNFQLFTRPCVAGAILQSPPSLFNSCVRCQVLDVRCHVSWVKCHMSSVRC